MLAIDTGQRHALDSSAGTSLAGLGRRMCRVASTRGEAILNILDALCLVRVREPILAHVQVVTKADGAASHKDLGY